MPPPSPEKGELCFHATHYKIDKNLLFTFRFDNGAKAGQNSDQPKFDQRELFQPIIDLKNFGLIQTGSGFFFFFGQAEST